MLCKDFNCAEVCATDADGVRTTLIAHYEYGQDANGVAVLTATRYADAAGVPVDTAAMKVSAGACPIISPDVEWQKLCDVDADDVSTEFMCQVITSFDAAGKAIVPPVTAYYELDKVTPYVPAGTVGPCPDCPPAEALGVLTAWGA